jgi:CheY-like chemotaxis protein
MDADKHPPLHVPAADGQDIAASLACDNTTPTDIASPAPAQRMLLVEDNADLLELTLMMLEELGHEAAGVATAEDALALLEKGPYTMLLTDVTLPKMSGVELVTLVRARYPRMPVAVASGYGRPSALDGVEVGYLKKPYQLADLQQLIKQGLQ